MSTTVSGWRDRAGHLLLWAIVLLALPSAAAAQAGSYKALRFDVTLTPSGGDLLVREAITFEFESGTFRRVWRDIPAARTDGIEIVEARMDDAVMPVGPGEGHVEISGRARVKVQWNFAPVGRSAHIFDLKYIARGAIYREGETDVLRWRALPGEHKYAIEASHIAIAASGGFLKPLETRHVGTVSLSTMPPGVLIDAAGIGSNGWIVADVRYPAGSLTSTLPKWQQQSAYAASLAPRWMAGAAALLALGLLLVFGARQGYSAPAVVTEQTTTSAPPEPLPAALAAVLAARGRTSGHQGISTILDLADRGVLTVRELPRTLGVRQYELDQVPGTHQLESHEETALHIAFAGRDERVSLTRVRGRLARGGRRFVNAVNADMEQRGLLDPSRKAARDRLTVMSIAMLMSAALSAVVVAGLIPSYQAWPFLLPLGVLLAALVGIVSAASMSPLSDRGAVEAARWQGFKRYLKAFAAKDDRFAGTIDSRWIVYAIAVGLAPQWARFLKGRPAAAPGWFVAARGDEGGFAAFVGSHAAASAGHGSGAGGGAAAGGGASGAG